MKLLRNTWLSILAKLFTKLEVLIASVKYLRNPLMTLCLRNDELVAMQQK